MIFDADLSKAESGVWLPYDGARFLIAHISNPKFQRALSRLQHPYRKKLQDGTLDPEINKGIVAEAMAEGVLLGWEGVKNRAGEDVPYTVKNASALLKHDPDFRDWVSETAMNMAHFRDAEVADLGEGSKPGSNG